MRLHRYEVDVSRLRAVEREDPRASAVVRLLDAGRRTVARVNTPPMPSDRLQELARCLRAHNDSLRIDHMPGRSDAIDSEA